MSEIQNIQAKKYILLETYKKIHVCKITFYQSVIDKGFRNNIFRLSKLALVIKLPLPYKK